ncbi:GDP-mannose 4,6-dehydratase [Methanospirillum lacunae]|uniref:GDP-mannose 4,6-dehydratase n=1 Tax=Methanospirillum lacunae TaxID=668570 RepID=UPI001FE68F0C|nr:GDP-mannose 4,6-dehydratase [Methanospirillum lacunae]
MHSYWIPRNYRDGYGMFSCYGILFNHKSLRGGDTFVTGKITRGIVAILWGKKFTLKILMPTRLGFFS